MLKKLIDILKYYDSEPLSILLGFVWITFFPIIWYFEFGVHIFPTILSVLVGVSLIKSTCIRSLRFRKALAYGSFLFSIFIVQLLFLNGGLEDPANFLWLLPLLMSFINLTAITLQYYKKQYSSNGSVR
jgi:hypothetical protein